MVIIVAATALTWVSEPDAHNLAGPVVVAMPALAMGIQNAMVRVHGEPDIATNVMTVTSPASLPIPRRLAAPAGTGGAG